MSFYYYFCIDTIVHLTSWFTLSPSSDGPGSDGNVQCTLPPLSDCLRYLPHQMDKALTDLFSVRCPHYLNVYIISPPDGAGSDKLSGVRCHHYLNVYLIPPPPHQMDQALVICSVYAVPLSECLPYLPHQIDQALMDLFSVRCPHYLNVYFISPTR